MKVPPYLYLSEDPREFNTGKVHHNGPHGATTTPIYWYIAKLLDILLIFYHFNCLTLLINKKTVIYFQSNCYHLLTAPSGHLKMHSGDVGCDSLTDTAYLHTNPRMDKPFEI